MMGAPNAESVRFDVGGCFVGHEPRECGDHRTVGDHRAWCHDCSEWCYPDMPCIRCEIIPLRAALRAVTDPDGCSAEWLAEARRMATQYGGDVR